MFICVTSGYLISIFCLFGTDAFEEKHFESIAIAKLSDSWLVRLDVRSSMECAIRCLEEETCMSFNIGPKVNRKRECELFTTGWPNTNRIEERQGWRYMNPNDAQERCQHYFENSCYWRAAGGTMVYSEAKNLCHRQGGHILDVLSQEESDFVHGLLPGGIEWWLAAEKVDGDYIWYTTNQRVADGFHNWHMSKGEGDCSKFIHLNRFDDESCANSDAVLCEFP